MARFRWFRRTPRPPGPGDCPECGHRWDEHAGSGNDRDGVCGECAYEVEHGERDTDAAPCRRPWPTPVRQDLRKEMRLHMAEPFPESVEKGEYYGEVDAVMIGADIYGWATRAGTLSTEDRAGLSLATAQLRRSIDAFPSPARPYYERLARIAGLTLDLSVPEGRPEA